MILTLPFCFPGCKNPMMNVTSLNMQYLSLLAPPTPIEGTVWFLECKIGYIWADLTYVNNITCSGRAWTPLPPACIRTDLFIHYIVGLLKILNLWTTNKYLKIFNVLISNS